MSASDQEPAVLRSPADLQRLMRTDYALSEQQWDAVTAPLEPGVVIAGAGSGKTTLMAARVVYLVATGAVRPDQVLGLTFTAKATGQLRQGIREALDRAGLLRAGPEDGDDAEPLEPAIATYNAYAAGLLTEHGLRIGFEPDTRVLADASRYQLAARVVQRYAGTVERLTDHPETAVANLLALESAMSEHLVSADQVLAHDEGERPGFERAVEAERAGRARKTHLEAPARALDAMVRRRDLLGLVAAYRAAKRDHGLMDFSEQVELGVRLVEDHPEVGRAEREKFRIVLLDEYQDTSVAQARLLARLFGGHPVTAVGDPHQAIYGWRGASVSNIVHFGDDFPAPSGPVRVRPLSVSRRSDRLVLDAANRLAAPLHESTPGVRPLDPAPGAGEGEVRVVVHETDAHELADLAVRVEAAHQVAGAWSEIGVLTRTNTHAAAVFDALTDAGIPVEIVGLSGLLRLPEVAEVLAVLRLVHDVTENAALLTLLTGPRWAVGPRDLALLGRRARELTTRPEAPEGDGGLSVADELAHAVVGSDPTEVASLGDALDDPGEAAYSAEARERFGLLAAELRQLRGHAGEPLLDLVRRVIDVTGIDVELASALSRAAAARRDNLDLFVKAVAEFQPVDGDLGLPALLAYLTAEDEMGNGLDAATPTEADSVKLLTVHRAKGLEWHSVFLVGVCEGTFPTTRGRTLWTTSPAVLPARLRGDARDLPQLEGHDKAALDRYRDAAKQHDREEELRLGYVAVTRAAHVLTLSSFLWSERATPFGPSPYQREVRDLLVERGLPVDQWHDLPARGTPNPVRERATDVPWPAPVAAREAQRRRDAAERVRAAMAAPSGSADAEPDEVDRLDLAATLAEWDDELERLLAEAAADRAEVVEVPLPSSLSATALARLRDDPAAFAADLARPMPRRPSAAARFGTRFHAWVESRFGQQGLIDPDDLPGRADTGIDDDADLRELTRRFADGPFGDRPPLAVEAPFALVIGGQVVRGRIDAVYAEPDGAVTLVDWKTSRHQESDPLQLAVYRQAWAELHGLDPERVRVAFHYVRTGRTVVVPPEELPDRAALEALLSP